MIVLILDVLMCCRFGGRELIGGVAVQLEHADLFGLSVHSRIEPQSSGHEVQDGYSVARFHSGFSPGWDKHNVCQIKLLVGGREH